MNTLRILTSDPWLEPYSKVIEERHAQVLRKLPGSVYNGSLESIASSHQFFGLHRRPGGGFVFREYAPNATGLTLIGDFSDWKEDPCYKARRINDDGVWEVIIPKGRMRQGQFYKMIVYWDGGSGERIPAYANRVVQDPDTKLFAAQVDLPIKPYRFRNKRFKPVSSPLLIYECHIGMAQETEGVGSYNEFRTRVLPHIHEAGYNAIQIMGIQEHPYYGSFGYHVSSFFAPSSRFGTGDDLKHLIDDAHGMGIAVIMDLVHSHAVKNEAEGLGCIDGSGEMYFHSGERRLHPAWDSLLFNYGKDTVINFLLSNCKYWLDEFHFDGFRFDGVTSMLYYDHGLGKAFTSYADYYDGGQDTDAITYLTLANLLIHEINPHAITIAEEMSGMPGLALPFEAGGIGFDYRMAMGIPDYWIKLIKEKTDEQWLPSSILYEMSNRRADEKTISYCESHDQALVGDKTIIFRLADKEMYWHMMTSDADLTIERAMALHKMIRLVTIGTINGGYLNFMGNEFGHPEWIDFPREGNGWSHKYARRQWSLLERDDLKYKYLNAFDKAMIHTVSSTPGFTDTSVEELWHQDDDQVLVFRRGSLVFAFNWNPTASFTDYGVLAPAGKYRVVLDTDDREFGGLCRVDDSVEHFTNADPLYNSQGKGWLKLYLPARSALVLRKC